MSRSWSVSERGVPRKSRLPDEDCQERLNTRDLVASYEEARAVERADNQQFDMQYSLGDY